MKLKNFNSFDYLKDPSAKGTVNKNNQIYTSLYDYYMSKGEEPNTRQSVVGWLNKDSQIRNFSHILEHINEGDLILDYGCGVGDLVPFLHSNLDSFDYVGVDINSKFIEDAKKNYKSFEFYLIEDPTQVNMNFDKIVAIGVFTWYITKNDFKKTINHLFSKCNNKMIITCIHTDITPHSWANTYRGYNEDIFLSTFPNLKNNMKFFKKERDLVVIFEK